MPPGHSTARIIQKTQWMILGGGGVGDRFWERRGMEGWPDLDKGQGWGGVCSLDTVPKSTQSMGSSAHPHPIISADRFPSLPLRCSDSSAPATQPLCNPSGLPQSQTALGFLTVHSKCTFPTHSPSHPLLTPAPSVILPQSSPQHPPSPQSHLRETFSCPSLSFALSHLFLGLFSPISSQFSENPTLHHLPLFSLSTGPHPSHDRFTIPCPST